MRVAAVVLILLAGCERAAETPPAPQPLGERTRWFLGNAPRVEVTRLSARPRTERIGYDVRRAFAFTIGDDVNATAAAPCGKKPDYQIRFVRAAEWVDVYYTIDCQQLELRPTFNEPVVKRKLRDARQMYRLVTQIVPLGSFPHSPPESAGSSPAPSRP